MDTETYKKLQLWKNVIPYHIRLPNTNEFLLTGVFELTDIDTLEPIEINTNSIGHYYYHYSSYIPDNLVYMNELGVMLSISAVENLWKRDDNSLEICIATDMNWGVHIYNNDQFFQVDSVNNEITKNKWNKWSENIVSKQIFKYESDAIKYLTSEKHSQQLKAVQKSINELPSNERGDLSDGYHTYNELYDVRLALTVALCNSLSRLRTTEIARYGNSNIKYIYKSKNHSDGTPVWDNWFIVVANLGNGQISFHYEMKDWDLFQIVEVDIPPTYDNHTTQDVINRLKQI